MNQTVSKSMEWVMGKGDDGGQFQHPCNCSLIIKKTQTRVTPVVSLATQSAGFPTGETRRAPRHLRDDDEFERDGRGHL